MHFKNFPFYANLLQVIKDNKIQVRAKHEEKTQERLSKSKFNKEYELNERIETYSLTGGLSHDGKLYVGAYGKGHGEGCFVKPGAPPPTATPGPDDADGENPAAVDESKSVGGGGDDDRKSIAVEVRRSSAISGR